MRALPSDVAGLLDHFLFPCYDVSLVDGVCACALQDQLYEEIFHFWALTKFRQNIDSHVFQNMDDQNCREGEVEEFNDQSLRERQSTESKELMDTLVQFYSRMRNPSSTQINQIQKSFVECQKKILKVVEHRKDLQRSLELSQLKKDHSQQLFRVNQNYTQYESTIASLVKIIHDKQNTILKLETELNCFRMRQEDIRRMENVEAKALAKINQSMRELKATCGNLVQEMRRPLDSGIEDLVQNANDQNREIKEFLRSKQALIESKLKMIRMKQQMLELSEQGSKKYTSSLKQAIKLYETLIEKFSEQAKSSPNPSVSLISGEESYSALCRTEIAQYEKELLRMRTIWEEQSERLKNVEKELEEKKRMVGELEERLKANVESGQREGSKYETRIAGLEAQIEKLKEGLKLKQESISKYQITQSQQKADLEALNLRLNRLSHAHELSVQSVFKLEKELKGKENQLEQIKDALKQKIKLMKQREERLVQHQALNSQLMQSKLDLCLKIGAFEQQVRTDMETILNLRKENQRISGQLNQRDHQCEQLSLKITSENSETLGIEEIKQILQQELNAQWSQTQLEFETILASLSQMLQLKTQVSLQPQISE